MMARGDVPFFEPGLEPLLRKHLGTGWLRITTSYAEAAAFGDVHFLCVGTPQAADGAADLRYLYAAVGELAPRLTRPCLIVGKSTVPVGTARTIATLLRTTAPAGEQVELAWNPEFLREGCAVTDSLKPDRMVFGVASERAAQLLHQIYAKPMAEGVPALMLDLETAELAKLAANAFLATKISFINAMAEVCEAAGADVVGLAETLAHDERIGRRYLRPGLGFGGGCLPKDIRAFAAMAEGLGAGSVTRILREVDAVNMARRSRVITLARQLLGKTVAGRRIAVLGIAFKPGSDDIRDSPSLDICKRLLRERAIVSVHDPVALKNAIHGMPGLRGEEAVMSVAKDAELILHLTEWPEYKAIDPKLLATVVAQTQIIDARCTLDAAAWRSAGWTVRALGNGRL
jgi:UDPglucose 6-dehydrogenase